MQNDSLEVSNKSWIYRLATIKLTDVENIWFPTLILIGKNRESPLVVLEGHMRLTAMFLAPEWLPAELEVMVGFSEQIERWGCY